MGGGFGVCRAEVPNSLVVEALRFAELRFVLCCLVCCSAVVYAFVPACASGIVACRDNLPIYVAFGFLDSC